ncbi:hypothetical protein DMA12_27695 [Amycolatopsis balhimycina DSM 5908]|uniref:Uncharacterized protein n=1 Tax=Amycolatopsis balhimycina DSM 5908 TaxID=1081091 RepID=A0A428WAQ9_AMYBA|nr:hypothetical protein [Amycolatopsis balhimycina]RSM40201.1 hypothetical protein DMA12_27695 [Amycolatopsis balhimycina DSM 5908]
MTTPAPSSRQRWLVPVVVVVLSVTVGGGLLARELYRRPDQPADDTSSAASTPSSAGNGEQGAANVVKMTDDARAHPQAEAVRQVLQTYFDAINFKKYQQWRAVVTADRVAQQPPDDWLAGIRSTKDSDALVYRIERGSGTSLRVLVGFTSEQKAEDGPPFFREPCIKWRLVMPMIVEKSALRIDTVDGGPPPEHEKC